MLRFGPDDGPVAIVALPLFEEANRTRAFAVAICRALAKRGIASVLPDLPGQGESATALETLSVLDMQVAYADLVDQLGRRGYGIGIRSGALLDALGPIRGRWHLTPQGGPALLRELTRIRQAAFGADASLGELRHLDGSLTDDSPGTPVEIAGNLVSVSLLADLSANQPFDAPDRPKRIVRLDGDAAPADRYVSGTPLWRRSEPGMDLALVQTVAADIADWIATCEA